MATITRDDGSTAEITSDLVTSALERDRGRGKFTRIFNNSYSLVKDHGGGLLEIEVNPPLSDSVPIELIPLMEYESGVGLRPGRYFVMFGEIGAGGELGEPLDGGNGILLASEAGQVVGDELAALPATITLSPIGEEDSQGEDFSLFLVADRATNDALTLNDLLQGLVSLAMIQLALERGDIRDSASVDLLPLQEARKPVLYLVPNSKVANKITDIDFNETVEIDVSSNRDKNKSVVTVVSLTYDGEGVTLSKPMTQFDRNVHNAVATLYVAGNRSFTTRQVWQALSSSDDKPSDTWIQRIEESIDKQRFTRAVVDFTEEARGRTLDFEGTAVESYEIDTYMLSADKHMIRLTNGTEAMGYTILRPPVLYQHSAIFNQIIKFPIKLLETSSILQNTEININIKHYLLRRIDMAKRHGGNFGHVRYATVYEEAGIPDPDKKQRKRVNDAVLALLRLWQDEGHIKGFREFKEGRTRAGVDIDV